MDFCCCCCLVLFFFFLIFVSLLVINIRKWGNQFDEVCMHMFAHWNIRSFVYSVGNDVYVCCSPYKHQLGLGVFSNSKTTFNTKQETKIKNNDEERINILSTTAPNRMSISTNFFLFFFLQFSNERSKCCLFRSLDFAFVYELFASLMITNDNINITI